MRDIKFRVIDENGEIYGFERLRNGRWERATAEDMPWEAGTFHIIAIREQSTGLKDKNGVDLDWWEGIHFLLMTISLKSSNVMVVFGSFR